MMKTLTLLAVALAAPLWAAEEAPKLPPAIQAIVEKAEADVSKNRKVYDAANSKSLDAAEKALKAELEKMTKAGKLEEAMAAKKMLESVRADVVARIDERAKDNGGLLGDEIGRLQVKVISMADFNSLKVTATPTKGKAIATSEYSGSYSATNAIDGNPQTEWALRGSNGSLSVTIEPARGTRQVYFVSRSDRFVDPVSEGVITINKSITIPVKDFPSGNVICIILPNKTAITSIEYAIKAGINNPGLSEILLDD